MILFSHYRLFKQNTAEYKISGIFIFSAIQHSLPFFIADFLDITMNESKIRLLRDQIKTIRIEIDAADHLIGIGGEIEQSGKLLAVKPGLVPATVNNGFKYAGLCFPERPGAIILFFTVTVSNQDFFIAELTGTDQVDSQTEPGTTGSGNDIIILLSGIQKL